jgi:hypothetical protein
MGVIARQLAAVPGIVIHRSLTFRRTLATFHATGFPLGGEMASGRDEVLLPYLKALVLLQLEALRDQEIDAKPELLLHRAGIGMPEIAEMVGKTYAAVAKSINRAKGGTAKERVQKAMSPTTEE